MHLGPDIFLCICGHMFLYMPAAMYLLIDRGCMFLHVPEAMRLLMCPGLHVPLCTQGCEAFCVFKATCTMCLYVSEPAHLPCTWDNMSICVWEVCTWSFLLYFLPS